MAHRRSHAIATIIFYNKKLNLMPDLVKAYAQKHNQ